MTEPKYPSNSYKKQSEDPPKSAKPPVEKIVSGKVTRRKKTLGRRIKDLFSGDRASSVGSYVFEEILVPAAKDLLFEMVTGGTARAVFGTDRRQAARSTRNARLPQTRYDRMADPVGSHRNERRETERVRTTHDFDDIVFDNRGEAEDVLDHLIMLVDTYESATVDDFLELVGMTGEYTDQRWGWRDLRAASISRVRDGYTLNLPRTVAID